MPYKLCGANLDNKKSACTVWQRIGANQNNQSQYTTETNTSQYGG